MVGRLIRKYVAQLWMGAESQFIERPEKHPEGPTGRVASVRLGRTLRSAVPALERSAECPLCAGTIASVWGKHDEWQRCMRGHITYR